MACILHVLLAWWWQRLAGLAMRRRGAGAQRPGPARGSAWQRHRDISLTAATATRSRLIFPAECQSQSAAVTGVARTAFARGRGPKNKGLAVLHAQAALTKNQVALGLLSDSVKRLTTSTVLARMEVHWRSSVTR